jgi:hypothetical protein
MSTQFQHKQIYKGTQISRDQNIINQTDMFWLIVRKEIW